MQIHEPEWRTLCVDIDNTLCCSDNNYADAEPIEGAREAIAKLRSDGWFIVLYSARHFNHWQTTAKWLDRHGFEYDQIVYGKPPARFYIDDRAILFEGNWKNICEQLSM